MQAGGILACFLNSRLLWNCKFVTRSGKKSDMEKGSLQRYSDPSFCSKFLVVFFEVNLFLNKSYSFSLQACNKTYLIFRT